MLPGAVRHDNGGVDLLDRPQRRETAAGSGRRLDQSCQCCTHRIVEIGIAEAALVP
jgi:hypothetical protein